MRDLWFQQSKLFEDLRLTGKSMIPQRKNNTIFPYRTFVENLTVQSPAYKKLISQTKVLSCKSTASQPSLPKSSWLKKIWNHCSIPTSFFVTGRQTRRRPQLNCTNQQPPQRCGAVSDPVWVGSKWMLAFPRVPVTPDTTLHFFAMLPPERPQKGSTQLLQNWSPVFSFSFLLPFFVSSFFSFS